MVDIHDSLLGIMVCNGYSAYMVYGRYTMIVTMVDAYWRKSITINHSHYHDISTINHGEIGINRVPYRPGAMLHIGKVSFHQEKWGCHGICVADL